jgi:ATP-dependent Lon protease
VPKDGPSAGITMATALASAITRRPVRSDLAMTGEITLRGRVLPIGGLKEKALGAQRAEMATVMLPARNEPDLDDLPTDARAAMTFLAVETLDQVLAAALLPLPAQEPAAELIQSHDLVPLANPQPSRTGGRVPSAA